MSDRTKDESDTFAPNEKTDRVILDLLRDILPKTFMDLRSMSAGQRRLYLTDCYHQFDTEGIVTIAKSKWAAKGVVFDATEEQILKTRAIGELSRRLADFFKALETLFSGPSWQDVRKTQLEHAKHAVRMEGPNQGFDVAGNIVDSDDD